MVLDNLPVTVYDLQSDVSVWNLTPQLCVGAEGAGATLCACQQRAASMLTGCAPLLL